MKDKENLKQYAQERLRECQLKQLAILKEIDRICQKHGILYWLDGGTLLGAKRHGGFIPWDDDIDIAMGRDDLKRFETVAPAELPASLFLQTPKSDPNNGPIIKVRDLNSLYLEHGDDFESGYVKGIYVDIFPFDKIPKQRWLERLQHKIVFFLNGLFIATEIWQWKHCGKCDIPEPRKRGWLPCFFTRLLITLFSKHTIYNIMYRVQTAFNGRKLPLCKNIITKSERVPIEDVKQAQSVTLGSLQVSAPKDLLLYLNNHYGSVRKDIPDEMKISHRPEELIFPETP